MARGTMEVISFREVGRLYHKDSSIIRLRPTRPDHGWAIDFVHDKLSNVRSYKMLTVLDECTREALCVSVGIKMGAADVLEALYPLLLKRGTPTYIRSDNVLYSEQMLILAADHRCVGLSRHVESLPQSSSLVNERSLP